MMGVAELLGFARLCQRRRRRLMKKQQRRDGGHRSKEKCALLTKERKRVGRWWMKVRLSSNCWREAILSLELCGQREQWEISRRMRRFSGRLLTLTTLDLTTHCRQRHPSGNR